MALKKQIFAAAISHGLDPNVAATWHPDLPRSARVLVPIQLDALVVRSVGGAWADCRMRTPDPENPLPVDSSTLLPEPFAELLANGTADHIVAAAGRERDDQTHGFGGIALRGRNAAESRQQEREKGFHV